jgi:signal transduction histidine kinase
MRFGIKTKQVAGVTLLVGLAVILLSSWYLAELAHVYLEETKASADLLAGAIANRAFDVIRSGADPVTGLQTDAGLRSILVATAAYPKNVTYAAIVDLSGVAIAHSDPSYEGQTLAPAADLQGLFRAGPIAQTRAIFSGEGQTYEMVVPLSLTSGSGPQAMPFGSIRIGVSTLLIRSQLTNSLQTPMYTALAALVGASLVAMLLAQVVLRPIHVIRSGLARLGRGELDVKVDLPPEGELADLGDSFKAVSERLAADRTQLAGQQATLESVVEHLEDAVAFFAQDGTLLFANPAMRAVLRPGTSGPLEDLFPADHPYRTLVDETLSTRRSRGPIQVWVPGAGERLLHSHVVEDAGGRSLGVMLVARNLAYLTEVESTLSYSRKLAALGRLSAGIAHEVKNPLNATMIHLELLKMKMVNEPAAMDHVRVIAAQMRRLDEVVQGFLKFTRPEDLKLQAVSLSSVIHELMPIITAEAEKSGVEVRVECPTSLPLVSADPGMLQQAFLNLALNGCQAMPNGGRLRIAGAARPNRRVEIVFEDTGVGIPPEDLERIFELYFTTKEHGTGIGLTMVFRTVQLHDGDIEVQSVPGRGTTFRVVLRQAALQPLLAS